MKFKHALAASIAVIALVACEVPEDDGTTAADRAEVNSNKDDKADKSQAEDDGPDETAAHENASESAERYLDQRPFSRAGLIEQLEFEGYTHQKAVYGVNKVGL